MTTLLALYRRPDGGDEALAEFERRYAMEHLRSSPRRPASEPLGSSGSRRPSAPKPTSS